MADASQYPGLYRLSITDRLRALVARGALDAADAARLERGEYLLSPSVADKMIENVVGVFGLPLAVAPNFLVNDREYLVPMVVEEPSIVAGLSSAAKLFRSSGGFSVQAAESLLAGQLQLVDIDDPDEVVRRLHDNDAQLKELADAVHPKLVARGGGIREIEYYKYRLPDRRWTVVLHLLIDTCDAMGANLVNTVCEALAPRIAALSGARVALKILSNLADRSLVTARVRLPLERLGGDEAGARAARDDIVQATNFADTDRYRAATHNKGIMNGIDAVAVATGNDWRAIEAGAHAYAARDGRYRSLSRWTVGANGSLEGELTVPLKVGTVGGSHGANPAVALALAIAGVASARELAMLMAAVGLAQNFAALRALVTHGIQKGHMKLHARSVAAGRGAPPELFERVVAGLIASGEIKPWKADELIAQLEADQEAGQPVPGDDDAATGSACGKVILLGEHAAVYDKHVLALPLADAVRARVREVSGDARVSIPAWGIEESLSQAHGGAGPAAAVELIMRELGIRGRSFAVDIEPRIPAAMGLGGSAAMAVAVIRAFDRRLELGLSLRAIDALAFECEKLAHGTPSGIDNNLATYGETVLYTRSAAARTRPIELAEVPPLVIAASGQRASTKEMVAGVRARYRANRALYDTIFAEIDELAVAAAVALRDRDYAGLGAMMNVCQGFLNALQVSTPELERMIDIARRAGAVGAKLTGSGGGGSIVALCPGHEIDVASALNRAGYAIIRMGQERTES